MAYSELIKNFEKVRAYMREFYVYGFKSRNEYDAKSARSYDDEKRRIESYLGDYMGFLQTAEGKKVFLSVDSRVTKRNPFYKAWKAKSFTDKDITLHFLLFDILYSPEIKMSLADILDEIDEYLAETNSDMTFEESTVRKKLKEYIEIGIIQGEKDGKSLLYHRTPDLDVSKLGDVIGFFSEAMPCGVVGSFLQDRSEEQSDLFSFKHHYITQAIDSDIVATLLQAMHEKRYVTVENLGRNLEEPANLRLVPLRIYISAQNGRQNLIAFHEKANRLNSYRVDFMSNVQIEDVCEKFDKLRVELDKREDCMWGVNCNWNLNKLEHVEFDVYIGEDEQHILNRLEREKRCGTITRMDESHYRFCADVFNSNEMLPWIRTFIARITRIRFSNKVAESKFKKDLKKMYRLYDMGGDEDDF